MTMEIGSVIKNTEDGRFGIVISKSSFQNSYGEIVRLLRVRYLEPHESIINEKMVEKGDVYGVKRTS